MSVAKNRDKYSTAWSYHIQQMMPLFISAGRDMPQWYEFVDFMELVLEDAIKLEFPTEAIYTISDWRQAVASNETAQGFLDWAADMANEDLQYRDDVDEVYSYDD